MRFMFVLMLICMPFMAIAVELQPWSGPRADFEKRADGIYCKDWWQGGGLAVAYYTGPNAKKMGVLVNLGKTLSKRMGQAYQEIHAADLRSSDNDSNGVLVYPDGTARVRLLIMPGGNSTRTMMEIGQIKNVAKERAKFVDLRKIPQSAFKSGMNYVGMCGGFYTGANGYTVKGAVNCAWGFWPGKNNAIGPGMKKPFPAVQFDKEQLKHPLLKGMKEPQLENMFFNGGPESIQSDIPDTEYFGVYKGGAMAKIIDQWFCIAYRPSDNPLSGRAVMTTGHPEVGHPQFLNNMADYALDHDYKVTSVALTNGTAHQAVVGDQQMHYFHIDAQAGQDLTVRLSGLDQDCDLYLRHELPPSFKKKDKKSTAKKLKEETIRIKKSKAGTYYIGVFGKHLHANGANYTLTASFAE